MSTTYVSAELKREVAERADHICEYCLIHQDDTYFGCHVDHIVSEKHGGLTTSVNLALACSTCNLRKGSDIASVTLSGILTRLYNPRIDKWSGHFTLVGATIKPVTPVAEVTATLLQLNSAERVLEREELAKVGRYPCGAALKKLPRE